MTKNSSRPSSYPSPGARRASVSDRPDDLLASRIVAALDAGADRLPYRVSHRLQLAREAALAMHAAALAPVAVPALAGGLGSGDGRPSLGWRIVATLLPLGAIVAGFLAISDLGDALEADETAEIDEAVLVDELPISAYADHGFAVFLKNNRP